MKTHTLRPDYGFIILCDSQAGDYPEWADGDEPELFARSGDGLFIATRPDHLGAVTIELYGPDDAPAPPNGHAVIFSGQLQIDSGQLKAGSEISDAWVHMSVPPGSVYVHVSGDTIPDPQVVRVHLYSRVWSNGEFPQLPVTPEDAERIARDHFANRQVPVAERSHIRRGGITTWEFLTRPNWETDESCATIDGYTGEVLETWTRHGFTRSTPTRASDWRPYPDPELREHAARIMQALVDRDADRLDALATFWHEPTTPADLFDEMDECGATFVMPPDPETFDTLSSVDYEDDEEDSEVSVDVDMYSTEQMQSDLTLSMTFERASTGWHAIINSLHVM